MNVRFLATLLGVVALTAFFMHLATAQLIAPKGEAGTGFSGTQAMETLTRILGPEIPHVAGSTANGAVKDRILKELTEMGYTPEVQARAVCAPPETRPGCSYVENIVAIHKGTRPGKAVLATAHYDSVPAGPGVGDDLAGTAVMLELAKWMAKRETKNDIVFLITDGEEVGLRGALAFAAHHPLFKQVGIVVNVEARGASGPSMMFETGKGSARLMGLFARTVPHPRANSVTYEVYQLLPNDTDFTVYRKAAGLSGFNFAFSNSASLYHSRNDNLANLDRDTLQQHGDNAFATVGALADVDLETLKSDADASYFDLHGQTMLIWPAAANVPIAALSLLAIIGLIVVHRAAFAPAAIGYAALAIVASILLLFAAGWLLSFPLGIWPGVHPLDHPAPWPARIALATAGIAVAHLVAMIGTRIDMRALLLASWLLLSALALAVAVTVTGAAYPFMWPAAAVALVGWVETFAPGRKVLTLTAATGFVFAAFFFLTFLLVLELVLGFDLSQFKILVLIPFVLALSPLIVAVYAKAEARTALALLVAVTAISAFIASQTPAYAPNHPRGQNLTYYDDGSGHPRWFIDFVGAPDAAYLKKMGFPAGDAPFLQAGLFETKTRAKEASDLKLGAPQLVVDQVMVQDKFRLVRAHLQGTRGALQLALAVAGQSGIQSIRVAGEDMVGASRLNQDAPLLARLTGFGTHEIPIEILYDPAKDPVLKVIERASLPDADEARTLAAARAADAAPVHGGDTAVVIRDVDLNVLAARPPEPPH